MNAQGLMGSLTGVSSVLNLGGFFQDLVTKGTIKQDELDGTRKGIASLIAILKQTPTEKIEAMVAQYDTELTSHHNKFHDRSFEQPLNAFRNAQVMMGYVESILVKSGIRG